MQVVTCGSEPWTLTMEEERALAVRLYNQPFALFHYVFKFLTC